ncbi:hypothetical protein [Rhodobium gokarnense]|uniref:Uncharacterized protein n=1 Tax=Rhodobium gokarnense TaxID=364296 RepID=A0ABT3H6X9_9HYPH|nr:hypothetical protein [Rhodobium gokarnense]MCW2306153.1 hypothetical protein [Rhodobium gokarnense]
MARFSQLQVSGKLGKFNGQMQVGDVTTFRLSNAAYGRKRSEAASKDARKRIPATAGVRPIAGIAAKMLDAEPDLTSMWRP